MNDHSKILASVDATPIAQVVADYAAWAAQRLQAPLEFLHVLDRHAEKSSGQDHSGTIGLDAQEKLLTQLSHDDELRTRTAREEARVFLNRLRERALAGGATEVGTRLRHGKVEETLAEQQDGTRLLVIGRAGSSTLSGEAASLGKHLEWVIRSATRPILVANTTYCEPSQVLFAFDGSAITRRGVDMLAASPLLKGLPIHLVMSGTASASGQRQLDAAVDTLNGAGLNATAALLPGTPHEVIAEVLATQPFNLLVMGAYSHSPWRSLLQGSKTSELLKRTQVATLLLR